MNRSQRTESAAAVLRRHQEELQSKAIDTKTRLKAAQHLAIKWNRMNLAANLKKEAINVELLCSTEIWDGVGLPLAVPTESISRSRRLPSVPKLSSLKLNDILPPNEFKAIQKIRNDPEYKFESGGIELVRRKHNEECDNVSDDSMFTFELPDRRTDKENVSNVGNNAVVDNGSGFEEAVNDDVKDPVYVEKSRVKVSDDDDEAQIPTTTQNPLKLRTNEMREKRRHEGREYAEMKRKKMHQQRLEEEAARVQGQTDIKAHLRELQRKARQLAKEPLPDATKKRLVREKMRKEAILNELQAAVSAEREAVLAERAAAEAAKKRALDASILLPASTHKQMIKPTQRSSSAPPSTRNKPSSGLCQVPMSKSTASRSASKTVPVRGGRLLPSYQQFKDSKKKIVAVRRDTRSMSTGCPDSNRSRSAPRRPVSVIHTATREALDLLSEGSFFAELEPDQFHGLRPATGGASRLPVPLRRSIEDRRGKSTQEELHVLRGLKEEVSRNNVAMDSVRQQMDRMKQMLVDLTGQSSVDLRASEDATEVALTRRSLLSKLSDLRGSYTDRYNLNEESDIKFMYSDSVMGRDDPPERESTLEEVLLSRIRDAEYDVRNSAQQLEDVQKQPNQLLENVVGDADLVHRPPSRSNYSDLHRSRSSLNNLSGRSSQEAGSAFTPVIASPARSLNKTESGLHVRIEETDAPVIGSSGRYAVGGEVTKDPLLFQQLGMMQDRREVLALYGIDDAASDDMADEDQLVNERDEPFVGETGFNQRGHASEAAPANIAEYKKVSVMPSLLNVGELRGLLGATKRAPVPVEVESEDDWTDESAGEEDEHDHRMITVFARDVMRQQERERQEQMRADHERLVAEHTERIEREKLIAAHKASVDQLHYIESEEIAEILDGTYVSVPDTSLGGADFESPEPVISQMPVGLSYRPEISADDGPKMKSATELRSEMELELHRQQQLFNYAMELSDLEQSRVVANSHALLRHVVTQSQIKEVEGQRKMEATLQQHAYESSIAHITAAAQIQLLGKEVEHAQEQSELKRQLAANELQEEYLRHLERARETAENFERVAEMTKMERALDQTRSRGATDRDQLSMSSPTKLKWGHSATVFADEASDGRNENDDSVIQEDVEEQYYSTAFETDVPESNASIKNQENVRYEESTRSSLPSSISEEPPGQVLTLRPSASECASSIRSFHSSTQYTDANEYSEVFDGEDSILPNIRSAIPIARNESPMNLDVQEKVDMSKPQASVPPAFDIPAIEMGGFSQLNREYKEELDKRLVSHEKALALRLQLLTSRRKYQVSLLQKQLQAGKLKSSEAYHVELGRVSAAFDEGNAEIERDRWAMHARAFKELRKLQDLQEELDDFRARFSADLSNESSSTFSGSISEIHVSKFFPDSGRRESIEEGDKKYISNIKHKSDLIRQSLGQQTKISSLKEDNSLIDFSGMEEHLIVEHTRDERDEEVHESLSYLDSFEEAPAESFMQGQSLSSYPKALSPPVPEDYDQLDDEAYFQKQDDNNLSVTMTRSRSSLGSIGTDASPRRDTGIDKSIDESYDVEFEEVEEEEILIRDASTDLDKSHSSLASIRSDLPLQKQEEMSKSMSYADDFDEGALKCEELAEEDRCRSVDSPHDIQPALSTEEEGLDRSHDTLADLEESIDKRMERVSALETNLQRVKAQQKRTKQIAIKEGERRQLMKREQYLVEQIARTNEEAKVLEDEGADEASTDDRFGDDPMALLIVNQADAIFAVETADEIHDESVISQAVEGIRYDETEVASVDDHMEFIDENNRELNESAMRDEVQGWVRVHADMMSAGYDEAVELLDEEDALEEDSWGSEEALEVVQGLEKSQGLVEMRVTESEAAIVIQARSRGLLARRRAQMRGQQRAAVVLAARADVSGDLLKEHAAAVRAEQDLLEDSFASEVEEEDDLGIEEEIGGQLETAIRRLESAAHTRDTLTSNILIPKEEILDAITLHKEAIPEDPLNESADDSVGAASIASDYDFQGYTLPPRPLASLAAEDVYHEAPSIKNSSIMPTLPSEYVDMNVSPIIQPMMSPSVELSILPGSNPIVDHSAVDIDEEGLFQIRSVPSSSFEVISVVDEVDDALELSLNTATDLVTAAIWKTLYLDASVEADSMVTSVSSPLGPVVRMLSEDSDDSYDEEKDERRTFSLSSLTDLPPVKKPVATMESWDDDENIYDFKPNTTANIAEDMGLEVEEVIGAVRAPTKKEMFDKATEHLPADTVEVINALSESQIKSYLDNPSANIESLSRYWTSNTQLSSDENGPLLPRVAAIVSELHRLRHATNDDAFDFPRRLLARALPASRHHVAEYVARVLDRDQQRVGAYLDGRGRLYDLVEVEVEEKFNREFDLQIQTLAGRGMQKIWHLLTGFIAEYEYLREEELN